MSSQKPVVVYAASGYTGRLTCESLTRLRIPFVAAGRSLQKLDEVVAEMRAKGADCVAAVANHSPAGLQQLFRGAKVVINISGPFSLLGRAVVEAALSEGCHYLDSTGEQDFMLDMQRDFGASFARDKLVLSPSTAFLWALGCAAAEICLETSGVDSIKIVYAPPTLQTVASLQSMVRCARRPGYVLMERELTLIRPTAQVRQILIPGTNELRNALSVGASETTFFVGDPRVRNCETLFANNDLAKAAVIIKLWSGAAKYVSGEMLDRWSDALVLRLKKDPPPEQPETSRFVVAALGEGNQQRVSVVLNGTSPYVVTGFLGAIAAQLLLEGKARRFGFVSTAQAFGARYLLRRLDEIGTTATVDAPHAREVSRGGVPDAYSERSA
jgi:hypothetical protein